MLVGEIYPNEGLPEPETSALYQGNGNDELHLAFDFSPMYADFSAASFRRVLTRWYRACGSERWPSHVLSNHDQSRAMTRLAGGSESKARLLAALLLTQRGTPFLYYGEEIGMTDGRIPRKHMQDPLGIRYWPFHPGRDRSRTPMQWNPSGGFSSVPHSWLPMNPDTPHRNVEEQTQDSSSLFSWYRRLIALRRSQPELHKGNIDFIESGREVLMYRRSLHSGSILIALNFSSKPQPLFFGSGKAHVLADSTTNAEGQQMPELLQPFQVIIATENP
jgi:alpha-glucosidase